MNKVILMGRLTRDPEVRYTTNTNALVCSFSLAMHIDTDEGNAANVGNGDGTKIRIIK